MVNFVFALIEVFFAIYYGSGVMGLNVCSWAVFTGVDLFARNFYLDRVIPQQPFLAPEN